MWSVLYGSAAIERWLVLGTVVLDVWLEPSKELVAHMDYLLTLNGRTPALTTKEGLPSYQTDSAPSYHDWLRERMLCEPEGQGGQPALAHPFEAQLLAAE